MKEWLLVKLKAAGRPPMSAAAEVIIEGAPPLLTEDRPPRSGPMKEERGRSHSAPGPDDPRRSSPAAIARGSSGKHHAFYQPSITLCAGFHWAFP